MTSLRSLGLAAAIGSSLVVASPADPRAADGSVSGLVTDERGAALAQAKLIALHPPTRRRFVIVTTANGRFHFFQLPVGGPWLVSARRIGSAPPVERIEVLAQGEAREATFRLVTTPVQLEGIATRAEARIEAIGEFEVDTNVSDVTQGRQGGGEVAAVTGRETNTRSGTLFSAFRADEIGARLDYQGRDRSARPSSTMQSGAPLGGPIPFQIGLRFEH